MKTITLAHYTMKDIEPAPWVETWENLMKFGSRMAPKLIISPLPCRSCSTTPAAAFRPGNA